VRNTDVRSNDVRNTDVRNGDNPPAQSAASAKAGTRIVAEGPSANSSDDTAIASKVVPVAQKSSPSSGAGVVKKVIVETDDDDASDSADPAPLKVGAKSSKGVSTSSAGVKTSRAALAKSMREAQPTSNGDRSLIRALGLKIGKIVIDPGHGGHDTGTIGPNGLLEKDLVLDVSKRLGKLLQARLGAEVVFTRRDDTFIPLETRTVIANQEQADLFVSVHANSSHDPDARGVETYYLNFTSSPEALEVAARENAASDQDIHELQDLVKKIALKEKIEESREFASDVQQSLHSGLAAKTSGVRDRGVKKAPFVVLIGANMPSILAEISFISNPGDEKRLKSPEYRQRIAESLYRGISRYVNGLGGVKVASRVEKASAD
jgi:N-acetylmuramoyl-L-alanine amidase